MPLPQHPKDWPVIEGHNYVIYAEDATESHPHFFGFADTIEQARKIKFEAELAGFTHVAMVDGNLQKVEQSEGTVVPTG